MLSVCGCDVQVACSDAATWALLHSVYQSLVTPAPARGVPLQYRAGRAAECDSYYLQRAQELDERAMDTGAFLFVFEKDMTIEVEKLRRDLYFIHGAALELDGRAVLLVAESGGGKSITAWALLHHGFGYLSDELAPIDLQSLKILPYPHALCLKADPPAPYQLPSGTVRTDRTLHVPAGGLPAPTVATSTPLQAVFFLRYRPARAAPAVHPVKAAEAGMRLYAQALNALAHPADGLDAALQIARAADCYALDTADLRQTCDLLHSTLADIAVA